MNLIYHTGSEPKVVLPQVVDQVWFIERDRLWQKAFEVSGVSQLSAASRKPSGIDSGVALREMNEIETERFAVLSQAFEAMFVDIAKLFIEAAKREQLNGNTIKVKARSRHSYTDINWADVDLENDQYTIQGYSVNSLPSRPEGRKQFVQELLMAGMIDQKRAIKLLNFPDLEADQTLEEAAQDVIKADLEYILDTGEFISPEPLDDLQFAIAEANKVYHRARLDKVPEETLDLLRRYIAKCQEFIALAQPPQQPQGV
jgi:hypothetical protein